MAIIYIYIIVQNVKMRYAFFITKIIKIFYIEWCISLNHFSKQKF